MTEPERLRLRNHFYGLLVDAEKVRDQRPDLVQASCESCGVCPQTEWSLFERHLLWDAVNAERFTRGFPPIDLVEVERADTRSSGYSDYGQRFALACADLTLRAGA